MYSHKENPSSPATFFRKDEMETQNEEGLLLSGSQSQNVTQPRLQHCLQNQDGLWLSSWAVKPLSSNPASAVCYPLRISEHLLPVK